MTSPKGSKPIKIQFASDLHLEFERRAGHRLELPVALDTDVLVLAGDIHNDFAGLDSFIRPLATRLPVVLVAGNHEFFTHELNETYLELGQWAASIPGVHFLENQAVEIAGVTFLGAVLWYSFGNADPQLMKKAASMVADFAVIADRQGPRNRLRPERVLEIHRHSIAWLERELRTRDPARTVVVTHHAPSLRSSRGKGEDWDLLYGSDYDALIADCGPAVWIHGHVHTSFEYQIGRTTVACNPRGYLGYGENPSFDPSRAITLPLQ